MPPRSVKRRGAGQRWLLVPLAITVLVLLADASMHARSAKAQVALSSDAWVDRVLPQVAASSTQGREIADLTTAPLDEGAGPAAAELALIARSARSTYQAASSAVPPSKLTGTAGLLDACLSSRYKGAEEMSAAVQDLMAASRSAEPAAVAEMGQAVGDFAVSDNAYQLFAQQMPSLGFTVPASAWDLGAAHYGPKTFTAFAARVLAGQSHPPQHQLVIDSVSTYPGALSMQGRMEVLPPASALAVTVVVSDTGRSAEDGVTVSVSIAPAQGGPTQTRSTTVELPAGGSRSVVLGGLAMSQSRPTELKASATAPDGGPGSTSRTIAVEMAGSNFDATTQPPAASTTVPPTTSTTTTSGPTTTTVPATTTTVAGG